jgi:hypothetical protein
MKRLVLAAVAAMSLVACGGQSAECKKMIECMNAQSAGTGDAQNAAYGPSGTCWQNSATTTSCTAACKSYTDNAATAASAPAACK